MDLFWNGIQYHYNRSFKEFYDLAAGNWAVKAKKRSCGLGKATLPVSYPGDRSLLFSTHSVCPSRTRSRSRPRVLWQCGHGEAMLCPGVAAPSGSKSSVLSLRRPHCLQPPCPPLHCHLGPQASFPRVSACVSPPQVPMGAHGLKERSRDSWDYGCSVGTWWEGAQREVNRAGRLLCSCSHSSVGTEMGAHPAQTLRFSG